MAFSGIGGDARSPQALFPGLSPRLARRYRAFSDPACRAPFRHGARKRASRVARTPLKKGGMPLRRRVAFWILVLASLAAPSCRAQAPEHDLRLGGGVDVVHKQGMAMAALSIDNFSLLTWDNHLDFGLGLGFRLGSRLGWNGQIGGIAVRRTDDDLGTHLNFLLRASYCGERWCLSYAHISHGALIGLERSATNSGLNFMFLEYRFP
jgi:hypothetical protein